MIYTVTFNPALDYVVSVEDFQTGSVNRSAAESIMAGGKGINVSKVLKNLGHDSTALGFVAGFTGFEISSLVKDMGFDCDFIAVADGFTRINVKLKSGEETEINGKGPTLTDKNVDMLFHKLDKLTKGDTLVLAGSVPSGVNDKIYGKILEYMTIEHMNGRDVHVVVDATKNLMMNTLKFKPFLVKPNIHELGEIFNVELDNNKDVAAKYAKVMQELGARNVLVSMAGDGALLLAEDGTILKCEAPKGTVINSVGAGDSMVAGFIAGWTEKQDYEHAFKMGVACGSASAFSAELAVLSDVQRIYNEVEVV